MIDDFSIERTADGSKTIFLSKLNEHYHSVKGALTESQHIFINMGLNFCKKNSLKVFEIGFGTGLNAYLTLLEAMKSERKIQYTSLELYPLDIETVRSMDYPSIISVNSENLFYKLHQAEWNKCVSITDYFSIKKIETDFTKYIFDDVYDVIYFDAFAPEKQPEMWSQSLFDNIYSHLSEFGVLTTYCAKGCVRRMLQAAGFKVERLQGPPNGKREILRAIKI